MTLIAEAKQLVAAADTPEQRRLAFAAARVLSQGSLDAMQALSDMTGKANDDFEKRVFSTIDRLAFEHRLVLTAGANACLQKALAKPSVTRYRSDTRWAPVVRASDAVFRSTAGQSISTADVRTRDIASAGLVFDEIYARFTE